MDKRAYWVWLQNALGAGSGKIRKITENFVSVQQFQEAGPSEWKLWRIFTEKEREAFLTFTVYDAEERIREQERAGIWLLTPEDPGYPEKLRHLYDFPAVLYGKGHLPDLDEMLSIAVVGTRRASRTGRETARAFGKGLAQKNVTVVSGGALGIDTAAHQGALSVDGITLCVLGCGIGYPYLMENAGLRSQILRRGALLSEYPLNTPPTKGSFPIRNRLISGLCDGTLVVEADMGSGSLITARDAVEQDRDVFAVPGSALQKSFRGTNNLIKSGAKMATRIRDILEEYTGRYPYLDAYFPPDLSRNVSLPEQPGKTEAKKPQEKEKLEQWDTALQESIRTGVWTIPLDQLPDEREVSGGEKLPDRKTEKPNPMHFPEPERVPHPEAKTPREEVPAVPADEPSTDPNLSEDGKKVLRMLRETPLHLMELEAQTGLAPARILTAVTELELEDLAETLSGNRYRRLK